MELAQHNVNSSQCSTNKKSANVSLEQSSFKQCFVSSVCTHSRLVSSLLDQVGLAYHRVFHSEALELFLVLINTDSADSSCLKKYPLETFSLLNNDLLSIQSKLISSMDLFVIEAFNNTKKQKSSTSIFNQIRGKHHEWKSCAKSRFEQVICPILEQKLINKTP
ncbi:MAG: hypothetical protein GY787_19405 [Alteromonadales bacterium]|nr:hypothetical protein [Alteromonadales bacterium]